MSSNEKLPNKDSKSNIRKTFSSKSFDLHGYSLDTANNKIRNLIEESYKKGINKLTIVTGKGLHSKNEQDPYISKDLGILKHSVPEYIKNNEELMKLVSLIEEADEKDGGGGAFYIHLKKPIK